MSKLSIIVPALNEALVIGDTLKALQPLRARGVEIIFVDGGSSDGSVEIARPFSDQSLFARAGRARQMNAGARAASGAALLFLHADSSLPEDADRLIAEALEKNVWGRFDVRLSGLDRLFRVIETLMNWRSRWTGIATGDQGIFVNRNVFLACGGYPEIELMEDIELSKRLKRAGQPACLRQKILSSSRRWERKGILRTVVGMWFLRLAYFFGASPRRLARIYERQRHC